MTGSAGGYLGETLAATLSKTIETLIDITVELPGVSTPREAADVVLRDDRKFYVGLVLLMLAALSMMASGK